MKKKKFRLRPHYIVLAALFLLLGISATMGKYTMVTSTGGTVKFQASLAKEVLLQEHKAERLNTGEYRLTSTIVTENTYTLIPGVDIPKDPHIVISGKTDIPAYLYIEIVDARDTVTIDGVEVDLTSYTLTEDWTATTEIEAKNSGTVYKYNATIDDQFTAYPIYILKDDKVEVSQHVKCSDTSVTNAITIYAYLVEAASIDNP